MEDGKALVQDEVAVDERRNKPARVEGQELGRLQEPTARVAGSARQWRTRAGKAGPLRLARGRRGRGRRGLGCEMCGPRPSSGVLATHALARRRQRMEPLAPTMRRRAGATASGQGKGLQGAVDDGRQGRPVRPPQAPPVTATAPTGPHESNCTRLPSKSTPFSSSTAHTRQAGGLRSRRGGWVGRGGGGGGRGHEQTAVRFECEGEKHSRRFNRLPPAAAAGQRWLAPVQPPRSTHLPLPQKRTGRLGAAAAADAADELEELEELGCEPSSGFTSAEALELAMLGSTGRGRERTALVSGCSSADGRVGAGVLGLQNAVRECAARTSGGNCGTADGEQWEPCRKLTTRPRGKRRAATDPPAPPAVAPPPPCQLLRSDAR